jgi:Fic family protein
MRKQMIDIRNVEITPLMTTILQEIDEYKSNWDNNIQMLDKRYLTRLKKVSTIESIGSSNRIEGNSLSDEEIKKLLSGLKKQSFRSRDEQEVAGYAELLDVVYNNYQVIPLNENYIRQLHKIMLGGVSKDTSHCGNYKTISNAVAAFDASGKEIGIIFKTATPFETPFLMEELLKWITYAQEQKLLHPLLLIGIFIVHFLAIHPFQDGNGRLSRALTALLLLRAGYKYVPYYSIESIIEFSKSNYYLSLRNTQKTIWDEKVNYEPWLLFFLMTLQKQKDCLIEKINFLQHRIPLSESSRMVLDLFENKPKWTVQEIAQALGKPEISIRKILQALCKQKCITKFGKTRACFYRKTGSMWI